VLRLASLLWRLRRANSIEAHLFELHAERCGGRQRDVAQTIQRPEASIDHALEAPAGDQDGGWQQTNDDQLADPYRTSIRQLTHSFLRMAKLDSRAFARLNRYEAALWRQAKQTIYALHPARYR
jgi:hypothetical protein